METPKPDPKRKIPPVGFTAEELDAELAKVEATYSARFAAELAKFHEEQRRRDEEGRRLGNE